MVQGLTLPENSFLSDQEQELQKLAYFGRFLVLTDFDDGWRYQMEKQLLDYLSNLQNDNTSNLTISSEQDTNKGEIFAIIRATELNIEIEESILNISSILQQKYFMTPIEQRVGYGKEGSSVLKVVLEKIDKEDIGYERREYQSVYAEVLKLSDDLESLNHKIDIYKGIDDELTQTLCISLGNNKKVLEDKVELLKEELKNILPRLYQSLSFKKDNTSDTVISSFQAEGIIKMSENTDNGSILELLQEAKNMSEQSFKQNQEQFDKFTQNIKELLNYKGIETQEGRGILTDYETESGKLVRAKIAGSKNSDVYKFGNRVHGFSVNGFQEVIKDISLLRSHGNYIYTFTIELENGKKVLCFSLGDEYKVMKIEGKQEFVGFSHLNYDNNDVILGGMVEQEEGVYSYFYLEEGIFKFIEIEGHKKFERLSDLMFDNDNNLASGIMQGEGESQRLFNGSKGSYSFLQLDGEQKFNHFKNFYYNNDKILLAGSAQNIDGLYSCFHKENGIHTTIEVEGKRKFKNIYSINIEEGKIISGEVLLDENQSSYFYIQDGEYKFLQINGVQIFKSFSDLHLEKGIPIIGGVKNINGLDSYFYTDNGKYRLLEIEGETDFYIMSVDIEGNSIIGGYLYQTEKKGNSRTKYGFEMKDGKFEYIKNRFGFNKNIY